MIAASLDRYYYNIWPQEKARFSSWNSRLWKRTPSGSRMRSCTWLAPSLDMLTTSSRACRGTHCRAGTFKTSNDRAVQMTA